MASSSSCQHTWIPYSLKHGKLSKFHPPPLQIFNLWMYTLPPSIPQWFIIIFKDMYNVMFYIDDIKSRVDFNFRILVEVWGMHDTFLWMEFSYLDPYGVYIYLRCFCRSFDHAIFLVPIFLVIIRFFLTAYNQKCDIVWFTIVRYTI